MNSSNDPYYKSTIDFKFYGHELKFKISQDLFSSYSIDVGTNLLLRSLVEADYINYAKTLDVGCGYGPIGITIKKLHPECEVHAVDRDALAVEYTKENSILNGFDDLKVYGSLLFNNVESNDFDLVISNIPAKIGENAIRDFLLNADNFINKNGIVAIVVVSPLKDLVKGIIMDNPAIEVLFNKDTPSYSVFHYKFTEKINYTQTQDVFLRKNDVQFHFKKISYKLNTAIGLQEFDSLNHKTEMIFEYLASLQNKKVVDSLIINNGQGHIAVFQSRIFTSQKITLIDRDLLALKYTQNNLALNGIDTEKVSVLHTPPILLEAKEQFDLIVVTIPDKELRSVNKLIIENALKALSQKGKLVICSNSTIVTRLIEDLNLEKNNGVIFRKRYKGQSLIAVKKR